MARMERTEPGGSGGERIEVLERADEFCVAAWGRIMLLAFRRRSTAEGVQRLHALAGPWARGRPGGVVLLNVVPPQPLRPPDEAMRAALRRAVLSPSPGISGVGTIFEGSGFVAAFVRALMSGLQRHSGRVPMRVFRTPAEAAGWAAGLLREPALSGERLAEAIRAVRDA